MRGERLVTAEFAGAEAIAVDGGAEFVEILVLDENRRAGDGDFLKVEAVQLAVMAVRLAAEDGQHRRLRAVEHGDRFFAAELDDFRRHGIDADGGEYGAHQCDPQQHRRRQQMPGGARRPPRPEQVSRRQRQPVPAAEAEPEGEGGECAGKEHGQCCTEAERPACLQLRQHDGDQDGERRQRTDQIAVETLDEEEGNEGDQEPEQRNARQTVLAPGAPGCEEKDEDPGQRDIEQAKEDVRRQAEELPRFEFVGEHQFGGFGVKQADDEEPGQRQRSGEQRVGAEGQPAAAQFLKPQAPAEEQRQHAAAADQCDDGAFDQEAGSEQQGCCGQREKAAKIEPLDESPQRGRRQRRDRHVEHETPAFGGHAEAAEQDAAGQPAGFRFARKAAGDTGGGDDQETGEGNGDGAGGDQ